MPDILINGEPSQHISYLDRGLQYGDGLFETILVKNGQAIFLTEHLSRLQKGFIALGFQHLDLLQISTEIKQLLSDKDHGHLKIIITRGPGERGYLAPEKPQLTRIILFNKTDKLSTSKKTFVKLRLCKTRLSHQPALVGIKHLNQLDHVLARNEWRDMTIKEGLMFDTEKKLIEGTMSNVFIVHNGVLKTPDLRSSGIKGVMRSFLLKKAALENRPYQIGDFTVDDLISADEVFITNSLMPIWFVNQLLLTDQCLNKKPGPVSYWALQSINTEIQHQSIFQSS